MLDVYKKEQVPVADGDKEISVEVFAISRGGLDIVFYSFRDRCWISLLLLRPIPEENTFKWMYPPQELLNSIKE